MSADKFPGTSILAQLSRIVTSNADYFHTNTNRLRVAPFKDV